MALTDNLQAFYKLSDLSDSSGNNRTLTNNGNVSFAAGKLGNAGVFDGSNYLSSTGNAVLGTSDFSVSGWVNATNLDGSQKMYYVGGSNGFTISLMDGILHTANANVADLHDFNSSDITNNSWFHMVVKRSGPTFTAYVNGQSIGTQDSGDTIEFTGDSQFIGAYIDGGYNIEGKIDAVGIWNRALSNAEVAELYNNGTGLELEVQAPVVDLEDGLQAFYKLSDTSDSSGNNRTLTNNGNVSFAPGKIGNAAVFDGSNFLQSNVQQPSTAMTVSVWAKLNNTNGPRFLIDSVTGNNWSGGGFGITTDNGSVNSYVFHGGEGGEGVALFTGSVDLTLSTDVWYHIVGTHDTSTGLGKLYINGSLNNSVQHNRNDPFGGDRTNPVAFGSNADGTYGLIDGQIDAVGIWNRALSDAEVAELYNGGAGLELNGEPQPTLVKLQAPVKFMGKVKFGV